MMENSEMMKKDNSQVEDLKFKNVMKDFVGIEQFETMGVELAELVREFHKKVSVVGKKYKIKLKDSVYFEIVDKIRKTK